MLHSASFSPFKRSSQSAQLVVSFIKMNLFNRFEQVFKLKMSHAIQMTLIVRSFCTDDDHVFQYRPLCSQENPKSLLSMLWCLALEVPRVWLGWLKDLHKDEGSEEPQRIRSYPSPLSHAAWIASSKARFSQKETSHHLCNKTNTSCPNKHWIKSQIKAFKSASRFSSTACHNWLAIITKLYFLCKQQSSHASEAAALKRVAYIKDCCLGCRVIGCDWYGCSTRPFVLSVFFLFLHYGDVILLWGGLHWSIW